MNEQIEQWRVQAYAANVFHLSQQEGSKLQNLCRQESFTGKAEFFDRLGPSMAQLKAGRNADTPNLNIDHSRRMLVTQLREWGTTIDRKDQLENIHDCASEYAKSAGWALGRAADNVIIDAAVGPAHAGETGATATALGNAQKVTAVASSALAVPNKQLLLKTKRLMDHAQVRGPRYIAYASDFLEALLGVTEITSSDYNTVKALVHGEVNQFLGFTWVNCEELYSRVASEYDDGTYKFDTTTGLFSASGTALLGTERYAIAFSGDAMIWGENIGGRIARIGERPDKSYNNQVYIAQDMGSVRLEEASVVQMVYKTS